jgi:hypothetical protein
MESKELASFVCSCKPNDVLQRPKNLATPLIYNKKIIGVIGIGNRKGKRKR